MEDLLAIDSCRPAHPVRLLRTMEQDNTPLDWQTWATGGTSLKGLEMASGSGLTTRWECVAPQLTWSRPWSILRLSVTTWRRSAVRAESLARWSFLIIIRVGLGIPKGSPDANRWRLIVDLSARRGQALTIASIATSHQGRGGPLFSRSVHMETFLFTWKTGGCWV